MDLFRRKQKLIFWIVTIIIVPSFVLVWGARDRSGPHYSDFDVGMVNGKHFKYSQYERFHRRMSAALGGMPLQFANIPGTGTQHEDLYKYVFAYALLEDAEKAGVTASDLQVGTYIENGHPIIASAIKKDDPQSKERAVDNLCRQMQISRQEFVQGVREWQTIGNYLQADSDLLAVNDETLYTFYSLNNGECFVKRIRFLESDGVKEQAKNEIMAKPAEELTEEIRAHVAANASDPRFRNPAKWRFSYVFLPFVSEDTLRQPTEAEIGERYEQGRTSRYTGKTLAEATAQIKGELLQDEVNRLTLRNYSVDVDPQLRGKNLEMPPADLAKITALMKLGAVAADTGSEPVSAAGVMAALPEGADFRFRLFIEAIDGSPEASRNSMIEEWKSGYNQDSPPFRADKGLFRLRLLAYEPSTAIDIDTADGQIKPEIYEAALSDLVGRRASEIVRTDAEEMERKLYDYMQALDKGETPPDATLAANFESMPTDTVPYRDLTDNNYQIVKLAIGDVMQPRAYQDPQTGERGQEIVVMVNRRIPSREDFAAEPDSVKNQFRQIAANNLQGNYGFTYTNNGPAAIIQPSPTITTTLADRYIKALIRVDESKFTRSGNEG